LFAVVALLFGARDAHAAVGGSMASLSSAGPVAAYNFDGGSGTTLADLSGNRSNGTISGANWTTAGHSGGALAFDGNADWVTVPDSGNLDLSSAMTLEAWVYPSQLGSIWRTIVTKEQSNGLVYGLFANSDTATPAALAALPAQDVVRSSNRLPRTTWTYLAATYDGAALRLYVNGVQSASVAGTGAMPSTTQPLRIGGNSMGSQWFRGRIDDLRVYDRALNASEIQNDMRTAVAVDAQAPSAPTALTASAPTMSSVSLSWAASTDNIGVVGYTVYRDGAAVASTTSTSYQLSGLACGANYSLSVDAFDAAGNRSGKTTVAASTSACPPPPDSTPPTSPSGLATSGATATTVTLSWNASTDDVGVAGYGLYRNSTSVGTTTTRSYTFSGLTCGSSYTLAVDAYDSMGNRSPRASISASTTACSDTAAPSAPSGLAAGGITATSITLSWSASTDNVGVTGYGRYLNGSLIASGTGTSYAFSGLTCGTNYALAVDAYDAAGNRSAKTSINATTSACPTADTQAPSVPPNERYTATTATSITLAWDPSTDNVGVAGYSLFLNNVKVGTTTQTSYTYSGLTCGTTYTISLQAFDAAGNGSDRAYSTGTAATSACVTAPADTQPPSVPPNERYAGVTQTTITLAWDPSTDNVGVAGYSLFLNNVKVGTTTQTSYTYSGLTCGTTYTVSLQAFDAAGNGSDRTLSTGTSATAACAPSSDTQAPTTPSALAATGATATSISIGWGASLDNVGVTGYGAYRNGTTVGSTTGTSYSFTGLSCGTSYSLAVDAYDAAGNRSAKATISASTTGCSDTSAPTTPTNFVATGATQTSVSLTWTASLDNVGVAGYTVSNGASTAGTTGSTSYTVSGLSCGSSYSLSVEAYDAAGNRSAKTSISASTSACSTPPPPSSPSSLANLWIDPSGGSCARQATAGAYSDAQACGSMQAASNAAQSGDTINIVDGSYSSQALNAGSKALTFQAAGPGRPSFGMIVSAASNITVRGIQIENRNDLNGPCSDPDNAVLYPCGNNQTFDNVIVDGLNKNDKHGIRGVGDSFKLRNSEVRNIVDGKGFEGGSDDMLIENTYWHNIRVVTDGVHNECAYVDNGNRQTWRGNRFIGCPTMALFFTNWNGGPAYSNVLVEDNVFGHTLDTGGNWHASCAFKIGWGANNQNTVIGWVVRYNTFETDPCLDGTPAGGDTGAGRYYGNLGGIQCESEMVYSYNVGDTCGGTGDMPVANATNDASHPNQAPFYVNAPNGDFHLVAGAAPINHGDPSNCPATDMDGQARSQPCDAGADER
jgi:chitodextrinase